MNHPYRDLTLILLLRAAHQGVAVASLPGLAGNASFASALPNAAPRMQSGTAIRALVPTVDVPGGRVVLDPPGGMFDTEGETNPDEGA